MADDKAKQIINNYISHAQKYIKEHKKNFSSFTTIYNKFIKKKHTDPSFEYTKEIIKRLEKDKVSPQAATQVTEILVPELQGMRKKVIIMLLPLIIGVALTVTFLILLGFTRPFDLSNNFVIYYSIGLFIGLAALIFGMIQRIKVKLLTLSNIMFYQAITAYSAAKMQGQGSFGAFRILEEMKANPGKELQIKVNKPKIVYK